MRLLSFLGPVLAVASSVLLVRAAEETSEAAPTGAVLPDEGVKVTATFLESNPFGHVVNGEQNTLLLSIGTNSTKNYTLYSIAGSVHHPTTNALIKNLTSQRLGKKKDQGVPLIPGAYFQLPYAFYSEFKPGDLRLTVWVEGTEDNEKYRVEAYDSVVTIVEPEIGLLDFKLISTYFMVAAILGGLVYVAYLSFVPQSKKHRARKPTNAPTPATPTATTTGYEDEWIPEHHIKKVKKTPGAISGTSGDELSGAESPKLTRKKSGKK